MYSAWIQLGLVFLWSAGWARAEHATLPETFVVMEAAPISLPSRVSDIQEISKSSVESPKTEIVSPTVVSEDFRAYNQPTMVMTDPLHSGIASAYSLFQKLVLPNIGQALQAAQLNEEDDFPERAELRRGVNWDKGSDLSRFLGTVGTED